MPETTDTSPNVFPEGRYKLTIKKVPLKKKTEKGNTFYEFDFEGVVDGETKGFKGFFWPSESRELLLAIGGKPDSADPKKITWEREEAQGKAIEATVYHVPQRKDPSRVDVKLKEITEAVPF